MLWTKGEPKGNEFKFNKGQNAHGIGEISSEIEGKKIKVRRSVKGIWGEKNGTDTQQSCKEIEDFVTTNKVIYKNYGMLLADGTSVNTIKVLDWIHWGANDVKNTLKMVLRPSSGVKGRYDYYELGEKITKVISGPLKEIRVSEEGISDGRGNQIKWSDKFKPTFTVELEK